MKTGSKTGFAAACLTFVCLIAYSHSKVSELMTDLNKFQPPENLLPSSAAAKACALGYDQLLADWYWLVFVQYIGDGAARGRDHYAAADKYLQLIVDLDPGFIKAYWFASFIIGSERQQPDLAAKFIDRGIQANPDNWYLPFIAGINQYLYARNDTAAAKYYKMAAKFLDAPTWLSRQSAILEARIPASIKEINIWDSIYGSSRDEIVREKARGHLISLWMQVYKSATTDTIKNRARSCLRLLGVSVD
jgi:tetratricopeptide (TPR) repeat protein